MKSVTYAALLTAAAALVPASAGAAALGENLVVNGDAETGDTAAWSTTGGFEAQAYNQGGFPGTGDVGVAQGGGFLFGGGNAALSTASQRIDLSTLADRIDSGSTLFTLSALLGGFSSQDDNATVAVSFLGDGDAVLGGGFIGPVLAADRASMTGLLARSTDGLVPVGTRLASLVLTATRTAGSYDDGYLDNVSLVLREGPTGAVPEPASWAMMIAGLGGVGGIARRSRRRTGIAFA